MPPSKTNQTSPLFKAVRARAPRTSASRITWRSATARGKVGLLVDLTGLQHSSVNPDSFVDPCIVEVTWGLLPRPDGKGGTIFVEGGMG